MSLEKNLFATQTAVGIAVIVSIMFVGLELRKNSFLMRKSMGDSHLQPINWLFKTLSTDSNFRPFHRRIDSDYENFTDDEKCRTMCLGIRSLRSILNELVAYFKDRVSKEEWISLQWNAKFVAKRPNFEPA